MKHNEIISHIEEILNEEYPNSIINREEDYDLNYAHGDTDKSKAKAQHQLYKDVDFIIQNYPNVILFKKYYVYSKRDEIIIEKVKSH